MKKVFVSILLLASIFVTLFVPSLTSFAAEEELQYDTYQAFVDFVQNNPNRTEGELEEKSAAMYLANELSEMGYDSEDLIQEFEFMLPEYLFYTVVGENKKSSQNVVAYKRCGEENAKLLVLGAYYGNLTQYPTTATAVVGGEGALYNGTGVAALLSIASWVYDAELSYDVAIVFFGAELIGSYGAEEFVKNNKQPLLGMINLTGVGGGDDLYIYYDEVKRTHGNYLDGLIQDKGYNILKTPFNKKYLLGGDEFPYTHIGLASSNSKFIKNGVPSVNIFGYNWSGISASESEDKPNLNGNALDTLENFVNLYKEENIREKLDVTVAFVTSALSDSLFKQKFEKASEDLRYTIFNSSTFRQIIKWVLFGVFVVMAVLLAIRANKITKKADPVYHNDYFEEENDIYGLNAEDKGDNKDSDEDIFDEF